MQRIPQYVNSHYSPIKYDNPAQSTFVTPDKYKNNITEYEYKMANLLGKVATLEANLEKEKRKNKGLENSLFTQSTDIRNLELEIARLQVQVQESEHLITQNNQKTQEIYFYQDSLEIIKKEMEDLNQNIHNKNKEFLVLHDELDSLRKESDRLRIDKHQLLETTHIISEEMDKIMSSLPYAESHRQRNSKNIVDEFRDNCELIFRLFTSIDQERKELLNLNESIRLDYSEKLIKEKQKSLKLEFEKKLLEERKMDLDKQTYYRKIEEKDKRIQELELNLLRVEEQKERRLKEISLEKYNMEDRFYEQSNEKENNNTQYVNGLLRRIKDLEKDKRELKIDLEKTREKYKALNEKYSKVNLDLLHNNNSDEYMNYMKQLRSYEEEKKIYEIKLEELSFKNKILESELQMKVIKG